MRRRPVATSRTTTPLHESQASRLGLSSRPLRTTSGRARQDFCFAMKPAVSGDSVEASPAIELDDTQQSQADRFSLLLRARRAAVLGLDRLG